MKLAFVFDVCFSYYQGHYYSINLSEEFWKSRYLQVFDEVVVVGRYKNSLKDPSGRLVRSDYENVNFKCIKDHSRIKRFAYLSQENSFIEDAIRDCDAVICRSWWGVKPCKKLGKNYMIEAIACAWDSYWNHSMLGKFVAVPAFLLLKSAIYNAPYVTYVTNEFLQKRYPTCGKNIGVSDVVLNEDMSEDVLKLRLNKISSKAKNEKWIIGTAAAVNVKFKGQEYVIRALAELKRQGFDNFIYQLAGNGDKQYLQNIAKKEGVLEQVEFCGSIPHDKIFKWYDSLDLYIQPSLTEGLPRAVVEAMSRGLPVVGTNGGGIPELIESNYIYKINSDMVNSITRLLSSFRKEDLIKNSERNFEFAKNYQADKLSQKRIEFLRLFAENK